MVHKKMKFQLHSDEDQKGHSDRLTVSPEETLEMVMSEIQYTDTSYTSASLETLVTPPLSDVNIKHKKKNRKKIGIHTRSDKSLWSSDLFSDSTLGDESSIYKKITKKKSSKEIKDKREKEKNILTKQKPEEKPEEEKIPHFAKPSNWKQMTRVQKDEWMRQRIIRWHAEVEAAKQRLMEAEKELQKQEEIARKQLMVKEAKMQEKRRDLLAQSCSLFQKHQVMKIENDYQDLLKLQWENYLNCNYLPNPTEPRQLFAYLNEWKSTETCTPEEMTRRFKDVFPILDMIDFFVSNKCWLTPETIYNINEARLGFRNQLIEAVHCTCYNILRNIEGNLGFASSASVATYHKEVEHLQLNVWVKLARPPRLKRDDEPPPEPISLNFPVLETHMILPTSVDPGAICVRMAISQRDLLSPCTHTYQSKSTAPSMDNDLFTFSMKEYVNLVKIQVQNEVAMAKYHRETNERIKELEKLIRINYSKADEEKKELETLKMASPPFLLGYHNPRLRIYKEAEDEAKLFLQESWPSLEPAEINLRKYRICGGVIYINLIETPPQPKTFRNGIALSTLTSSRRLQEIPFEVDYKQLLYEEIQDIKLPEEENEESQFAINDPLVVISMSLPNNVMWFEAPEICMWHERGQMWTKDCIYDVDHDMVEYSVTFRTSALWPLGFAQRRYCNMPYRDWDIRKDPSGKGVLFSLTGVYLSVTILCRNRCVVLKEVSRDAEFLADVIGRPMKLTKLKRHLQEVGIDIFPEIDGHNYVSGSCIKTWVMEKHFYHSMAFLSKAYNFKYSKWNRKAGVRNIVCQMREHMDLKRERKFRLLYVNPEQTTLLRNDEDMAAFSDESCMGDDFYPDLLTFNFSYGSPEARERVSKMNYKMTETVYELLQELKPCSFG